MKRKKGITLPEVVIALSITVIVMSLVASLIVIVSKISSNQNSKNDFENEFVSANSLVDEYFTTYNTTSFEIKTVENNRVVIKDAGENEYVLSFDVDEKKLSADILDHLTNNKNTKGPIVFKKLVRINFVQNDNKILCEYVFDGLEHTYKNLITFGV